MSGYDYYLGTHLRNQLLEVRFDAEQGCFLGQSAGSDTPIPFAPHGLAKTDLMGELGHLLASRRINWLCRLPMRRGASLSIDTF